MGQYLSPGVYVEEVPPLARPIAGVGTSTPGFIGVIPNDIYLPARPADGDSDAVKLQGFKYVKYTVPAQEQKAYRISSWNQYTKLFGDFIADTSSPATEDATPAINQGQRYLAHAVYGFFNNGGSSCYVLRITSANDLQIALTKFAPIDEITMVAAPGLPTAAYVTLTAHCESLKDRVAILDSVEDVPIVAGIPNFAALQTVLAARATVGRPQNTTYAAFYFPWLEVFDPAESLIQSGKVVYVPPSGHIAGIYARNDNTRGVFKAPANEAINGINGLKYMLSKADQDGLNDVGVNLIRPLIGAYRVWGARTVGGDDNGEYRYISTRRYFNYLRESIEQGTQFIVFEPNSPGLWERIKRTINGFLLNEWRSGALFGTTSDKAFFVKCDADTNPPEVREAGKVVTEIGVAIVKPAEFVIFRIQQTAGN